MGKRFITEAPVFGCAVFYLPYDGLIWQDTVLAIRLQNLDNSTLRCGLWAYLSRILS
jgi:hypothetical protein